MLTEVSTDLGLRINQTKKFLKTIRLIRNDLIGVGTSRSHTSVVHVTSGTPTIRNDVRTSGPSTVTDPPNVRLQWGSVRCHDHPDIRSREGGPRKGGGS